MANPDPKEARQAKKEKKDKQAWVATLWYQGHTRADIIKITGCSTQEVTRHLMLIQRTLTPKTRQVLEYRTNKVLNKINLVQKTAWDIIKKANRNLTGKDIDQIALAALRVITSSQELEAKVEGVTQEKLVIGPEKEASKLLSDVLALEKKASTIKDTGQNEKEPDIETRTPLPDFLREMDSAQS